LVALLFRSFLIVANAGDSRAILIKKDGSTKPLSHDHKVSKFREFRRISSSGGKIWFSGGAW